MSLDGQTGHIVYTAADNLDLWKRVYIGMCKTPFNGVNLLMLFNEIYITISSPN